MADELGMTPQSDGSRKILFRLQESPSFPSTPFLELSGNSENPSTRFWQSANPPFCSGPDSVGQADRGARSEQRGRLDPLNAGPTEERLPEGSRKRLAFKVFCAEIEEACLDNKVSPHSLHQRLKWTEHSTYEAIPSLYGPTLFSKTYFLICCKSVTPLSRFRPPTTGKRKPLKT